MNIIWDKSRLRLCEYKYISHLLEDIATLTQYSYCLKWRFFKKFRDTFFFSFSLILPLWLAYIFLQIVDVLEFIPSHVAVCFYVLFNDIIVSIVAF